MSHVYSQAEGKESPAVWFGTYRNDYTDKEIYSTVHTARIQHREPPTPLPHL